MKPLKVFLLLVLPAILLAACKQKTKATDNRIETPTETSETQNIHTTQQPIDIIRNYYNKAEKLKLPLTWRNSAGDKLPVASNKIIELTPKDTLLFGENAPLLRLIGVFPDTLKFYAFLFYYPGDDLRPYLITFNKEGEMIDQLYTGYSCGADCGFYCMATNFAIDEELRFVSLHESYRVECDDSAMHMDTTTVTYWAMERSGKILSTGKFKEVEELVKEKRSMPFNSPENPIEKFE